MALRPIAAIFAVARRLFPAPEHPTTQGDDRAIGGTIAEERESGFFLWFQLEPSDEPDLPASAGNRRSFRPSGDKFRPLVRLDVRVDDRERMIEAQLNIDRRFIEGRDSPFARDIASSFLAWALKNETGAEKEALIANIGNMRGERVIMRSDAVPPMPPADATGAAAVYGGRDEPARTVIGHALVVLSNKAEPDGPRWLGLRVAPGPSPR
jgi:hypothetical protein